jgi:hypothetical protein
MAHVNASTPFLGGNTLHVTSGTIELLLAKGEFKVQRVYWEGPTLASTSSLIISKQNTSSETTYLNMKCETSGKSQTFNLPYGTWWRDPYIHCVPTGDLWIYLC